MLTIGSLFSGVGGLDLGLERAKLGRTIWQVEMDPYCQKVLQKHWPLADRSISDVRRANAGNLIRPDLICGGFPCQGNSSAGRGLGLKDPRSALWYEFARVVDEMEPSCVIVENVASGARRWLPHVRRDLHMLGFRTRAVQISAFDVGAPHKRERVFILATHPNRIKLRNESRWSGGTDRQSANESVDHGQARTTPWQWKRSGERWTAEPPVCGVAHGVSDRLDRNRCLGNAVAPACAEVAGRILKDEIGDS